LDLLKCPLGLYRSLEVFTNFERNIVIRCFSGNPTPFNLLEKDLNSVWAFCLFEKPLLRVWWYVDPLTLLPLILTGVCDWRASAAAAMLPSLIGHLIYGGPLHLHSSCSSGGISDGCFSIHVLQPASSVAFVR
jgi:hypothetical protein